MVWHHQATADMVTPTFESMLGLVRYNFLTSQIASRRQQRVSRMIHRWINNAETSFHNTVRHSAITLTCNHATFDIHSRNIHHGLSCSTAMQSTVVSIRAAVWD